MIDFEPVDRRPEIERRLAAKSPESRAFMADLRERTLEEYRIYKMQLAAIREAGHLTQVELANKLGKPKGNVSRIEHAKI